MIRKSDRCEVIRIDCAAFTLVLLAALHCASALAQPTVYEHEPNDTPAQATKVSGAVVLAGAMGQGDQDGYLWTVSDVDAQKRWTFELHGIPGQLTIVEVVRLQYADNGVDVTGTTKLFTIGSRDGTRPALADDLIFEPGEYLLGVAHAGGGGAPFRPPMNSAAFGGGANGSAGGKNAEEDPAGGYRLAIREGSDLRLDGRAKPHGDRKSAQPVSTLVEYAAFTETPTAWYRLKINDKEAAERWEIRGQLPIGRKARAILRNSAGKELTRADTDRIGKFAFRDLGLAAGEYTVEVQEGHGGIIESLEAISTGRRIAGSESEPNDRWNVANQCDISQTLTGRVGGRSDTDVFAFTLGDEAADQMQALRLETAQGNSFRLCLLDDKGRSLQCHEGKGGVELPDLLLRPGNYGLQVDRGKEGEQYTVRLEATGTPQPGHEVEPNDTIETAAAVPANNRIKGRFSGRNDVDFYRFLLAGKPQMWRFQVLGDGISAVALLDSAGREVQSMRPQKGERRVRLDNLFLLPGEHGISVKGSGGGTYTLLALPLGAPAESAAPGQPGGGTKAATAATGPLSPFAEHEPNDDPTRSQLIRFGERRTGSLVSKADQDAYHFILADWDRIRLTVEPPAKGKVKVELTWGGVPFRTWDDKQKDQVIALQGLFPPGEYGLLLSPIVPSESDYAVHLERIDRFGCPVDCEPNDNAAFANRLPDDLVLEGRVGEWRDSDWYALPVQTGHTRLHVKVAEGNVRLRLGDWHRGHSGLESEADGSYAIDLPESKPSFLIVDGDGEYRLELSFDPGPQPRTKPAHLPVGLTLKLSTPEIAAYSALAQRLKGELQLVNKGSSSLSLALDAAASHPGWQVDFQDHQVQLAANGRATVPLTVEAPTDVWAARPVRVSVRAESAAGGHAENFVEIMPDADRPPVGPVRTWALPESLLGGFDVAWTALGGRRKLDPTEKHGDIPKLGRGFDQITDGLALYKGGLTLRGDHASPVAIEVQLAGGPVEVVGVVIDSLSGDRLEHYPKSFEVQLSSDGKTFSTALRGTLSPSVREQAFMLDAPVTARSARLLLSTTWEGRDEGILTIGEFKVIARPGEDISGGQGFDLSDPELGGHVAWARPMISSDWDRVILPGSDQETRVLVDKGHPFEWAVGFHDDRTAQISRIEWVDFPKMRADERIPEVAVAVSEDSPVGPWRPLGKWTLDGKGKTQVFRLDKPVWARYVKFSVAPVEERHKWSPPEEVRIWERPVSGDYRSILGEWGERGQAAIYEALESPQPETEPSESGNTSHDHAAAISLGKRFEGSAALGRRVAWYRVSVPSEDNTLLLQVDGDPTVRVVPRLEDADGHELPLRPGKSDSQRHRFEATVKPGGRYYIELQEPPRNVIFAWDTSGSVHDFISLTYKALATYVEGVVPGRDTVNLLPFGHSLLLRDWVGEPYKLQTVLNDYPRQESSSEAEKTLAKATEALSKRTGTKAIVLITDAVTPRYPEVWDELRTVKPRIFALHLDSSGGLAGNRSGQADLMQDWSQVNGGHYSRLATAGEMEIAFDRASALLRQPARYGLTVTAEHRKAPGPGSLTVIGSGKATAGGAVELILDASGSMLQHIGGKRRIEIAREVLTEAVKSWIPAGTPLALRVFGNKEANSCRTDLEIPLRPLDPAAVTKTIHGINAMNLAKTPIADSLAAVASDLQKAKGPKIIVLVTDGEETCGGDPQKALQELQDKGFDVTLNIVGFAIGDEDLQATFKSWAELGGGHFFAASDQKGLSGAVANALRTSYSVYDDGGTQVGEGWVGGEPLELDAGVYRVVVQSEPARTFDRVEVAGGSHIKLDLRQ